VSFKESSIGHRHLPLLDSVQRSRDMATRTSFVKHPGGRSIVKGPVQSSVSAGDGASAGRSHRAVESLGFETRAENSTTSKQAQDPCDGQFSRRPRQTWSVRKAASVGFLGRKTRPRMKSAKRSGPVFVAGDTYSKLRRADDNNVFEKQPAESKTRRLFCSSTRTSRIRVLGNPLESMAKVSRKSRFQGNPGLIRQILNGSVWQSFGCVCRQLSSSPH
jgi:hypothetical protein